MCGPFACFFAISLNDSVWACLPLSGTVQEKVFQFVRNQFKLPASADLAVLRSDLLENSCYRELTVSSQHLPTPLILYLSPDQHYVSASLVDLNDPIGWQQSANQRINALLLSQSSPSRGDSDATINLVEFSDMECSFCRRLHEWLTTLSGDTKRQLRITFKHFPSPSHPWGKTAAQIATCAAHETREEVFWSFQDFFFDNQEEINTSNLRELVSNYSKSIGLDPKAVFDCVDHGGADGVINRDVALAEQLNVRATPIVFINGMRLQPLQNKDELLSILKKQMNE